MFQHHLQSIRRDLREAGIVSLLDWREDDPPWLVEPLFGLPRDDRAARSVEVCDVDFVDDIVFLLHSSSALGLVNNMGKAIDIIIAGFRRYGLDVNLEPGKTEVPWKLQGHLSRKLAKGCGSKGQRMVSTPAGHRINVVDVYKHLGTHQHESGHYVDDAKAKAARCDKVYNAI